jgi:hypothetical protein
MSWRSGASWWSQRLAGEAPVRRAVCSTPSSWRSGGWSPQRLPTYPIITIAHPIANLRPEDLRKRTEEIFPQVLATLTRPPED